MISRNFSITFICAFLIYTNWIACNLTRRLMEKQRLTCKEEKAKLNFSKQLFDCVKCAFFRPDASNSTKLFLILLFIFVDFYILFSICNFFFQIFLLSVSVVSSLSQPTKKIGNGTIIFVLASAFIHYILFLIFLIFQFEH